MSRRLGDDLTRVAAEGGARLGCRCVPAFVPVAAGACARAHLEKWLRTAFNMGGQLGDDLARVAAEGGARLGCCSCRRRGDRCYKSVTE